MPSYTFFPIGYSVLRIAMTLDNPHISTSVKRAPDIDCWREVVDERPPFTIFRYIMRVGLFFRRDLLYF